MVGRKDSGADRNKQYWTLRYLDRYAVIIADFQTNGPFYSGFKIIFILLEATRRASQLLVRCLAIDQI
jgi:hypothetical protein